MFGLVDTGPITHHVNERNSRGKQGRQRSNDNDAGRARPSWKREWEIWVVVRGEDFSRPA